jgi:transketolase
MRKAFAAQLLKEFKANSRLMLLAGDLGYGVLEDIARECPRQYLNVGVAEQNMAGMATGLALEGYTVFMYSIANFPVMRCLEQVRNDICYHGANVKIVSIGGGFSYGGLGFSHHATEDLAVMRAMPNMTVVVPGERFETAEATAALARQDGPAYLRLDKLEKSLPDSATPDTSGFFIGKARLLRQGSDVVLLASGGIVFEALEAADRLAAAGVVCKVVSMHTLKPLDIDAVLAAAAHSRVLLTIEEHSVTGGLGSAVAEVCLESGITLPRFYRLGLRDEFASVVGSQAYLRKQYGMGVEHICATVRRLLIR